MSERGHRANVDHHPRLDALLHAAPSREPHRGEPRAAPAACRPPALCPAAEAPAERPRVLGGPVACLVTLAIIVVKPETVIGWHRRGFVRFWARRSRCAGRPSLDPVIVELIVRMARENPTWSRRRIASELAKLGHAVSKDTVARYKPRCRPRSRPPSHTWGTFVRNHLPGTLAIDLLTEPTATFGVLYVFFVLSLERRRVLHVNVTAHPYAAWAAKQMIEAVAPDVVGEGMWRELHRPRAQMPASTEPEVQQPAYALGWIHESYRGHPLVTHARVSGQASVHEPGAHRLRGAADLGHVLGAEERQASRALRSAQLRGGRSRGGLHSRERAASVMISSAKPPCSSSLAIFFIDASMCAKKAL